MNRREWLKGAGAAVVVAKSAWGAGAQTGMDLSPGRPPVNMRHFRCAAVEAVIAKTKKQIRDETLAGIFENCFPNTSTHDGAGDG